MTALMEILPIDIKHKEFAKSTFLGYNKTDVDNFCFNMADELGGVQQENKDLKEKLFQSRKEVEKLRSIEASLLEALNKTQSEKEAILAQSRREAEYLQKESKLLARQILLEAQAKSVSIQETAKNVSYRTISEMKLELKVLEDRYQELDSHKDSLVQEMTYLMQDTIQKIKRVTSYKRTFSFDEELRKADEFLANHKNYKKTAQTTPSAPAEKKENETRNEGNRPADPVEAKTDQTSFFDQF